MKHGSSSRRSRNNRGGGRRNNNAKSRVYDSNGPDVRIRGTSHQITDKYENLARDAMSSGDYVQAQSYLQHAEHYQRITNGWHEQIEEALTSGHQNKEKPGDAQGELEYPRNAYQIGNGPEGKKDSEDSHSSFNNSGTANRSELADA